MATEIAVGFARIELHCMIKMARATKDELTQQKLLLEEKARTHGSDQTTQNALLELDNSEYVIDQCLTKMWKAYTEAPSVSTEPIAGKTLPP